MKIKLENLEIAFFVPFLMLLLLLLLLPRLTRQNEVNKNAGNKKCSMIEFL
jgi:competence protein ComGC